MQDAWGQGVGRETLRPVIAERHLERQEKREEIAMKNSGHGIEGSKDVDDVYHLRLMSLLKELVRDNGYKGAGRILEVDQRTVAECAKTGQLTRRIRSALERALQEGVGSAADNQRRRNEELEERVGRLEGEVDVLGKEARRRLAAMEGEVASLRRTETRATGRTDVGAGVAHEAEQSPSPRHPPSRPTLRREYPDLATREPAQDDEEVFGEAYPLVVEWRSLKEVHPPRGSGEEWLNEEERLLEVELSLLVEHGMTLPPETQPLRGLDRSGQITWRRTALDDTRKLRARRELIRRVRRVCTLGLWWR